MSSEPKVCANCHIMNPEYDSWEKSGHHHTATCADCHLPYVRTGSFKVSDHWVRSPLLNVNRACQVCHSVSEKELLERVDRIQNKNYELLQNAGKAVEDLINEIEKAKSEGASESQLKKALNLQRKSQWYLDFISSENSMGFHAPQESARILANAANLARQGQISAIKWKENDK